MTQLVGNNDQVKKKEDLQQDPGNAQIIGHKEGT